MNPIEIVKSLEKFINEADKINKICYKAKHELECENNSVLLNPLDSITEDIDFSYNSGYFYRLDYNEELGTVAIFSAIDDDDFLNAIILPIKYFSMFDDEIYNDYKNEVYKLNVEKGWIK